MKVKVSVTQSCPTLCDPTDCSPPGLLCPRDSPGKNTRVDCHFLLQGFFLIQGLNPGLLHSRQILYHLSYRAVPDYTTFSKCGPQSPEGPQVAESCPNHAFEGKGAESQILDECVQECNFQKIVTEVSQAGIKIAGKNIDNLQYANDTTLMAESKEEVKSLLMKVKEESEKTDLKLNVQKTKIVASGPIISWQIDGKKNGNSVRLCFVGLQNHCQW